MPESVHESGGRSSTVIESFCRRLKVKLIYAEYYASIEVVRFGVFEYIEVLSNRKRRYFAIGNVDPAELEHTYA